MDGKLPLLPLVLHHTPRSFRQALAQEGVPYRMYRPGPAQGRFLVFDSRTQPSAIVAPGQVVLDLAELRREFEEDPFDALEDAHSERLQWQVGPWRLQEETARVDKRSVRRRLMDRLRSWIEGQGGLWLRVAPFPFPYRSAFCFRIDYDDYHPEDFHRTLDAVAGWEHRTSHFLTAGEFRSAPEALERLRGLDVGLHGYRHHTYRTEEENLVNIARGKEVLEKAGFEVKGFAAPEGQWNRALLAALEKLGLSYSSEFGLAYDELPFHPLGSEVLQIPVHPVSQRLFLEAAERASRDRPAQKPALIQSALDAAVEYFCNLLQTRTLAGEPLFLYGDSGCLGRWPRTIRAVLEHAAQYGSLWTATLTEIHGWWQVRSRVHLTVAEDSDGYEVLTHRKPAGFRAAVELWRGSHAAVVPLDRPRLTISPNSLAFEKRAPGSQVRPVRIDPPESFRQRLRRWLDWRRQTPEEQTGALSLPEQPRRNFGK
ncbi:MAG TPA: polysaccharide deacetylase family protein [Thermoguttaceae bacterium]|nr:polysaccharide deacetylase family protein [Thermoguttaceae bacterium]HPP53035.1 polysaccharide deacetylase family protein [Thermoguttaceae bacterium]